MYLYASATHLYALCRTVSVLVFGLLSFPFSGCGHLMPAVGPYLGIDEHQNEDHDGNQKQQPEITAGAVPGA